MRKVRTIEKIPFLAPDVLTKIVPSPTDGWDAIAPLAAMDPKRAPILINWVPRPGWVELRGGYIPFNSTLTASAVESLIIYRSPTGEKMFAAAGTAIYDVSVSGATTVAQTGLTNARWQWVNFTPAGAATVVQLCNGSDTLRQYNGTVWSAPAITGLPVGFTSASIVNIASSKRRLWYTLSGSTIFAFMPTDAITGPIAGTQDLGALWTKGGYAVGSISWTIDGGTGPQDYTLFISSRGQVSLYSGIDPTAAASWTLVGTFDISPPVGTRCMTRIGSDVAIITMQGVIPISQALPFDPSANRSVAITARIQNAMATAAQLYGTNFGWQFITFPAQQLAILNVPQITNSNQVQYVMNVLTGAWCQFTGWNANCFAIFNEKLYWGSNSGIINQGYIGGNDGSLSISADMQCAYNWFENPGRTKRMTMVQPLLVLSGALTPSLAVDSDFSTSTAVAPISSFQSTTLWDVAIWDSAVWSSTSLTYTGWLSTTALGHAMAIRMRVNVQTSTPTRLGIFDYGVFDTAVFDGGLDSTIPVLQVNAFNVILEMGGAI